MKKIPLLNPVSPAVKIAFLFIFLFIGLFLVLLFSKVVYLLPGVDGNDIVTQIYVGAIGQSVFAIGLPAYLVSRWTEDEPLRSLKMDAGVGSIKSVLFILLVFLCSYSFTSLVGQWNKGFHLPDALSGVEQVMRDMEDAALEVTNMMLAGDSVLRLLLNLIVVAGMAAVSEEMFFRGALQQFIGERIRNVHVTVWITAAVFSFVHFQFFGFLPRLFLGAILGYLFAYSGNLWIPILFHFLNNATVVVLEFFWGDTQWFENMEDQEITAWFVVIGLISLIVTVILLKTYKNLSYDDRS